MGLVAVAVVGGFVVGKVAVVAVVVQRIGFVVAVVVAVDDVAVVDSVAWESLLGYFVPLLV